MLFEMGGMRAKRLIHYSLEQSHDEWEAEMETGRFLEQE